MGEFLVVGAGISGCTSAWALAEQGHRVTVLEKSSLAGGKVLDYCCKATDSCSRCGVCVAHTQLKDALNHPNITLETGITIQSAAFSGNKVTLQTVRKNPRIDYSACSGCDACVDACPEGCITKYQRGEFVQYRIDYSRCRLHQGGSCTLCADACPENAVDVKGKEIRLTMSGEKAIVASGHEPFDAERKPRYGYARSEKIITGAEAEKLLSENAFLGSPESDIAFIQCVGSRDPQIGRNYCSAVCCSYALRMARMVKYRNPESKVTIYYIDIQNFDKEYNMLRKEIEDLGVRFVRGVPFKIDEISDGRLKLLIENLEGDDTIVYHDMVVLSVGMGPAPEAEGTASQFQLKTDEFGFYSPGNASVAVCGTCREPQSITDCMEAAKAAALDMGSGA